MGISVQKLVGKRFRALTDSEEFVLVKQYETASALTLSQRWGISKDTVWRILRDHNVTPRRPGRQPYDAS